MTDKIRAALVDYREMAVTKLAIRDADEALREYDARATPALPQGKPEPVAMFCRAEHSGDLGLQWNPAFDPYEGALLYSEPPKPQALPHGDEYKHAKCPGHDAYAASQALPQGSSYGFLHMLDSTEGLSENRPEIIHSFSSTNPFGRAGIDYDASFSHHVITLDRALHRQALPQGVEEWVEKNAEYSDRVYECHAKYQSMKKYVAVDDLMNLLSGMAIVPVVNIKSIVRDFEHHGRETPIRVEPFVRVNFAHEDYDSRDTFHAMLAAAKEKGFKKRELDVVELEAYDAGYLSSYGEGNVQWWHDYMRAELERARTFYEQQVEQMLSGMAIVPVERLKYLNDHHHATESGVGLARLALSRGDTQRAIEALNSTSEKLDSILDVLAAAKEPATCSVCGLKRSDTKNCKAPDCSPMREKE